MLVKGVVLMSVWVLIGLAATIGFAGVVLAQVPGADDVIQSAAKHGWESGVIAASILAIVAAVIGGVGYVGVRLFGKHDGIVTNEAAKVRLRWAEYITKMEEYHLRQSDLCQVHADTMVDIVVQCKESKNAQTCMCAVLEEIMLAQASQHDSKGPIKANMEDREDFANGMIGLAGGDAESVRRHMKRILDRKSRETDYHREMKAKLEKSLEDSGE